MISVAMDAQHIVSPQCIICEVPIQRVNGDLRLLCDGCRKPADKSFVGKSVAEFPLRPEYAQMLQRTFRIVDRGTSRGNPKLIDSFSYTYGVKRRWFCATEWQCTFRPKNNPCRATVSQRIDGTFVVGSEGHNHSAFAMKSRAKKKAATDPLLPVLAIVQEMLLEQLTESRVQSLALPC